MALDGSALVIRMFRVDAATGAESLTQTSVYTRRP
jgi:hypothetical protein